MNGRTNDGCTRRKHIDLPTSDFHVCNTQRLYGDNMKTVPYRTLLLEGQTPKRYGEK